MRVVEPLLGSQTACRSPTSEVFGSGAIYLFRSSVFDQIDQSERITFRNTFTRDTIAGTQARYSRDDFAARVSDAPHLSLFSSLFFHKPQDQPDPRRLSVYCIDVCGLYISPCVCVPFAFGGPCQPVQACTRPLLTTRSRRVDRSHITRTKLITLENKPINIFSVFHTSDMMYIITVNLT